MYPSPLFSVTLCADLLFVIDVSNFPVDYLTFHNNIRFPLFVNSCNLKLIFIFIFYLLALNVVCAYY